jgi:hypothetical protein
MTSSHPKADDDSATGHTYAARRARDPAGGSSHRADYPSSFPRCSGRYPSGLIGRAGRANCQSHAWTWPIILALAHWRRDRPTFSILLRTDLGLARESSLWISPLSSPTGAGCTSSTLCLKATVSRSSPTRQRAWRPCPLCQQPASSVHSRYQRRVADLPCGGRALTHVIHARG